MKEYRDKQTLERLYIEEGMSTREVADKLDCSSDTIKRWLRKHDIRVRDRAEAISMAKRKEDSGEWRDEDTLIELYREESMTLEDIADEFGVTAQVVWKWMDKYGIERRRHGETAFPHFETIESGYERWSHQEGVFRHNVYVHRLIVVSEMGFDSVKDKDVHHVNGIPWDNRPSNLVPLTRKEHMEIDGRIEQ